MTATTELLGGLFGVFLTTLIILWLRQHMGRTPPPRWLNNDTIASTVTVALTALSAFSSIFLVIGLIGAKVPAWLAVIGAPVAITLTIYAAVFLWREFHHWLEPTIPQGPTSAAP